MLHLNDNLYFGRLENGSVRILKLRQTPPIFPTAASIHPRDSVEFDVTIPPSQWASAISSVSAKGAQASQRYYDALAFHMNPPPIPFESEGTVATRQHAGTVGHVKALQVPVLNSDPEMVDRIKAAGNRTFGVEPGTEGGAT